MIAAEVLVAEHLGMAVEFSTLLQHLVDDRRRSLRADRTLAALALEGRRDAGVAPENRHMVARQALQFVGKIEIAVDLQVAFIKVFALDGPCPRILRVDQSLHLGQVAVGLHLQRDVEALVRVAVSDKANANRDDQEHHVQSDQYLRF